MSQTLEQIAEQLQATDKKVQLIYAFNGIGKTRLSRTLIDLVAREPQEIEDGEPSLQKILYYNTFTEDLFYWENDLLGDGEPKLKIQPNSVTDWILRDQGQDFNIITNFQHYANDRLTPMFNEEYTHQDAKGNETTVKAFSEVTFSVDTGGDEQSGNFKIS